MSIFAKAEKMLKKHSDTMAVEVTYRRGAEQSVLLAKLGGKLFRAENQHGMTLRTESFDFIVDKSNLTPFGDPKVGDEIVYDKRIFRVQAPNNEPCWRFHFRTTLEQIRIHTKHVGTEASNNHEC